MDERCLSILSMLISSGSGITIAELSKQLGVSSRTVRYDLDKIDGYLVANAFEPLIRNQKGIRLVQGQDGIQRLWDLLKSKDLVTYFSSQRERVRRIELELLSSKSYLTMERMRQILGVSRSTIVNDLKVVKLDFKKANIDLQSKPRYGFQLIASERKLREKIISIMLDLLPANEFIGYLNGTKNEVLHGLTKVNCLEFFKDINLELIYKVTKRMEKKLEVLWSDQSFTKIAYTIALCLKGKEKRDRIDFTPEQLVEIENARDYNIVVNSLIYHGSKYGFFFSRAEYAIITLAVLCADTNNISYYKKENQIKIQIIAAKIIKETGKKLGFDFTLNDTLPSILSEHLSHAYYRIKFTAPCDNPVYSEIGRRYKKIIRAVKDSLGQFETLTGHKVPENEIAGIAALFCGEYYGNAEKMRRYKILIVTGEGLAASSFLSAKLTAAFPEIDIMAVLTKHQMTAKALFDKADFVVTTVPLDLYERKAILVNPILDEDNISDLKSFISKNPPQKASSGSHHQDALTKVLSIAGRVCPGPIYNQLIADLVEEIGPIDNRYYHQRCDVMLRNLLTENTISLGVSANTWEEAVRLSGNLMVKAGCVEPTFVDAMVEFVKTNGPYVVIAPGIAIPHARPEDGVKKMCISLITLDNPVEFGSEDNDPVDLVIGLAAIDNSSHLDALAELIEILGDNQKQCIIRNAKSVEEIMVLFK
jgi:transcriptional antiterminator/mannitol/fructose-specific phosphotransferase system IIA component (Ntr-type)